MASNNRIISASEVQKHSHKNDAWIVIDGLVYDINNYMHTHPGGVEILMEVAGKTMEIHGEDATDMFDSIGHTSGAKQERNKYLIGTLEAYEAPPKSKDDGPTSFLGPLIGFASPAYRALVVESRTQRSSLPDRPDAAAGWAELARRADSDGGCLSQVAFQQLVADCVSTGLLGENVIPSMVAQFCQTASLPPRGAAEMLGIEERVLDKVPAISAYFTAAIFRVFDSNNDGVISPEEIQTLEKEMNDTNDGAAALLFRLIDANKNGAVDKAEMSSFLSHLLETFLDLATLLVQELEGAAAQDLKPFFAKMAREAFSQLVHEVSQQQGTLLNNDKDLRLQISTLVATVKASMMAKESTPLFGVLLTESAQEIPPMLSRYPDLFVILEQRYDAVLASSQAAQSAGEPTMASPAELLSEFERSCSDALREGWQPLGAPTFKKDFFSAELGSTAALGMVRGKAFKMITHSALPRAPRPTPLTLPIAEVAEAVKAWHLQCIEVLDEQEEELVKMAIGAIGINGLPLMVEIFTGGRLTGESFAPVLSLLFKALRNFYASHGATRFFSALLAFLDANDDGSLSRHEMLDLYTAVSTYVRLKRTRPGLADAPYVARILETFLQIFDLDSDGAIDAQDLERVAGKGVELVLSLVQLLLSACRAVLLPLVEPLVELAMDQLNKTTLTVDDVRPLLGLACMLVPAF